MRHFLLMLLLLPSTAVAIFATASGAGREIAAASQAGPHDAEFKTFFDGFIKAVKANDKEKIADCIQFPVSDWSVDARHNVTTESIKDRAEFIKKYDVLFTSSMRLHSVKAKPVALKDNRYTLIWREANIECSFEFTYIDGTGYRVTSYGIGPI